MDLILLLSLVVCAREGSVKERWLTIDAMKALGVWRAWSHIMCGGECLKRREEKIEEKDFRYMTPHRSGRERPAYSLRD